MTKADLEIRVWTQEQILRNARTIAISLQVDEQHQEGRAGLTSGKLSFVSELMRDFSKAFQMLQAFH